MANRQRFEIYFTVSEQSTNLCIVEMAYLDKLFHNITMLFHGTMSSGRGGGIRSPKIVNSGQISGWC